MHFMPIICILQVWLQSFAWTENSLSVRKQVGSGVGSLHEAPLLAEEPMFCFETAVKLLYWCGLAYEYHEVTMYIVVSFACAEST